MPAPELRISNRSVYFRKAISSPEFNSERVLARDAFQFGELWLKRNCVTALPYWQQARSYYSASKNLPPLSSPLTSYYCFLNAVKALLTVRRISFASSHGVAGNFDPTAKRSLRNEIIKFQGAGVLAELSKHLNERETRLEHSLTDILANLPFIHRAYRFTFRSHPEQFIPLRNLVYRTHGDYIWVTARIEGRFSDGRSASTLPPEFEIDHGFTDICVVRTKKKIKWHARNASANDRSAAMLRLKNYHRSMREHLVYISASPDLWYLKREVAGATRIKRHGLTLIMAAMHRLSELSRYDPAGLRHYLDGKENWLLTEFIELAPVQFLDEIVCEMTSFEFALPGIRPKSS